MAVPSFLDSSFFFFTRAAVVDVATIITDFRNEALNVNVPPWTEPAAGLFQSPVDGAGRFLDILLTRIAATNLEMRLRDQNAVTIATRRAQIDAGGSRIDIYSGQFHMLINCTRATPEILRCGILDLAPEIQSAHQLYVHGTGSRDVANVFGGTDYSFSFMLDNGVATGIARGMEYRTAGGSISLLSPSGATVHFPVLYRVNSGGNLRYAGHCYQWLLVPSSLAFDTEIQLLLDPTTLGTFKVTGTTTYVSSRLALRKA